MALYTTVAVYLLFLIMVYGQLARKTVTNECVKCICEASSGCNLTAECKEDVCGPYKITEPYWIDAGNVTVYAANFDIDGGYARCSIDYTCSTKTVKNYLERYAQDCNNNGVIDCHDYALIHRLGGYGCNGPVEPTYLNRYLKCQEASQDISNLIDVRKGTME